MISTAVAGARAPVPFEAGDVVVHDDLLDLPTQAEVLKLLAGPGWSYGAFSDNGPGASYYWFKHFAGYVKDAKVRLDPTAVEAELHETSPLIGAVWDRLKAGILQGHRLTRCYANGYPCGSEGGVHLDADVAGHFTAIYYPHMTWNPNWAGETLFFNRDGSDLLAAIYPRPNRLVVFPGVIPHVARGLSRRCPELRITLMFKTLVEPA